MTRNTIIALVILVLLAFGLIAAASLLTEEPSRGDAQSLGAQ